MSVLQPTDRGDLTRRLFDGARQLGHPASEAQARQLFVYLECLGRWNSVHNLSAWNSLPDMLVHHVLDSMTVVGPLERFVSGRSVRILDAGSGAGFPAAVLAVMHPEWAVTAVDAVAKKVAFVRQATSDAGIRNLVAVHARLEEWQPAICFDVVISRAFASLAKLAAATEHVLASDGVWVAQKGHVREGEIASLKRGLEVFHVEPVTVPGLEVERNLVWMRRTRS